jgi:rubrerythrin
MDENKTTEILKNAILLEKRGHAFYSKVAEQAEDHAVKEFFQLMADEENKHIQILSDQFKIFQTQNKFASADYSDQQGSELPSKVLTDDVKQAISAAAFEAAAISAAMSMEKNAIQLYANRAKTAEDAQEAACYGWLARWETTHLDFLSKIDREVTEQIWYDNQFWPF